VAGLASILTGDDNSDLLIEGFGKAYEGFCRIVLYFEGLTKERFLLIIKQIGNNREESYKGRKIVSIRIDIITTRFSRFEFNSVDEMLSTLTKIFLAYYASSEEERERNRNVLCAANYLHYAYSDKQFDNFKYAMENEDKIIGLNFEFVVDESGQTYQGLKKLLNNDVANPNLKVTKLLDGEDFLIEADNDNENYKQTARERYQNILDTASTDINNDEESIEDLQNNIEHLTERLQGYGKGSPKLRAHLKKAQYTVKRSRHVFF
jgi:hypothetical protein